MGLFQIKGLMRVSSIGLPGPHLKNSSASGRDHNRAWLTLKEQIHAKGEHCTSYKPWLQITKGEPDCVSVRRRISIVKRNIDTLKEERFDLLILGGGITGAGVALDATLRGFRVALIDKGDFASGTSSASSKLIHGGLRYLEHGGFHLVYEALHERRLLLQNAPHLVHPLRFVIPFYRGARVRPWKWRAGLTLYDLLAGRDNIRRGRPVTAFHLANDFPNLRTGELSGGAEYYDAQMDDARLCLAV